MARMMIDLREIKDAKYPNVTVGDFLTSKFTTDHARRFERDLFQTKWWDYRFMTPIEATVQFIDAYVAEARKIHAREIDYEKAQVIGYRNGANYIEVFMDEVRHPSKTVTKMKLHFTGYWRARCCADAAGIPYPIYLENVLTTRMRSWSRAVMPQAQHLYDRIDIEKVVDRWDELQATRTYYADHWAYMPENYRGAPAQDAYVDYLMGRVKNAGQLSGVLLREMIDSNKIAPEIAKDRLGEAEFASIVESRWH